MKAFKYQEVKAEKIEEGTEGEVYLRWLITKETGADNFAMRFFEVGPGGKAGPHSHPWEHEVFILEGQGVMKGGEEEFKVGPGSVVFIPSDEPHQLANSGDATIKYLCLVPYVDK